MYFGSPVNVQLNEYTVEEVQAGNSKYTPSYTETENGYDIVNTINQEKITISGTKTWVDPEGTEHPEITIVLLRDGAPIGEPEPVKLKNGDTTYSFEGLDKYDLSDGHEYVYTVSENPVEGYQTTYSEDHKSQIINTINQETTSISGTKTWVDPEGTTEHPEITINLIKNKEKFKTTKLANGNTYYEFTELPMYKVDYDGKYVLDSNGNVQLNDYRVEEENVINYETSYDGNNIINTFKQDIQGTVEITTTKSSDESVLTPLDVVFVLDVSGSMNDNDKDKTMIDAVNSAISTVMQGNPDSRVGVVAFSSIVKDNKYSNSLDATTLLPLGKYTPKSDGKYLTIKDDSYRANGEKYDKDIIYTNVKEVNSISLNVYGGTFTQAGIKAGADILTSANTKYKTNVNGKDIELTRTPVMILLSDGDPTYYKEDFKDLTGKRNGTGNSTSENDAYYTIRTADYYKQQITSHYYGKTDKKSKFYTIGLNMSETLSKTILDPSSTNVDDCNKKGDGYNWYGQKYRNVLGELYDKIIKDGVIGGSGKYSYADKSYVKGSMETGDLEEIFNTIIKNNTESTHTRAITLEESNARRVDLEKIDTSKAFSLTIGSTSYNFAQAQANGYVKNDTNGYYVDLSSVAKGTTVSISYNQ